MSRSYKKNPFCLDKKGTKKKRLANSITREKLKDYDLTLARGEYKKLYEQYNVCDYKHTYSWEEYWDFYLNLYKKEPWRLNKKELYRKWYKTYKMK